MNERVIKFDVMLKDRFVCTLKMELTSSRIKEWIGQMPVLKAHTIEKFIEEKRPSLKGKPYRIAFYNE